jgi:hypothetical protein
VEDLNPVQFQWKNRETGDVTEDRPRYGFLAQEVLSLEGEPSVLVDSEDPENLKLRESMMTPILVNALQELSAKVKLLEERIQSLESPNT